MARGNFIRTFIIKQKQLTSIQEAKLIAELADDKKAENIVLLDMRKVVNFCDYFVILSGDSNRQVHAIAQGIEEGLHLNGIKVRYKEGINAATWIVIDLGDVVVHIFETKTRDFYGLEHLWQDASVVKWKQKSPVVKKKRKTSSKA